MLDQDSPNASSTGRLDSTHEEKPTSTARWARIAKPRKATKAAAAVPDQRSVTAESNAGFLSRLTFSWISPLIKVGHSRPLVHDDIWLIDDGRSTQLLCDELQRSLQDRVVRGQKNALVFATYHAVKKHFWIGGASQLLNSVLQAMSPFLLRYLIEFASAAYAARQNATAGPSLGIGIGFVLGITAIQIIQSFAFAHFLYRSQLMGGLVRAILISATFEKSLKLSGKARSGTNALPSSSGKAASDAVQGWPNGRIMSMISTDISRIDQACGTFHYIWTSVIAIILTVGLLIYNLGVSTLAGVGFLIAGLAFVTTIVKRVGSKRGAINKITDKRVGLTAEVLQSIKFVKLFAWENAFAEKLKQLRLSETSALYSLHVMKSAIGSLSMALPIFANMLTFITYSLTGNQFEPAEVFSSLALLNSLRNPLNWVPVALGQAVEAWSAFERIEGFLLADELPEEFQMAEKDDHAVVLRDAYFTWEQPMKSDEISTKAGKPTTTEKMRNVFSGVKSKTKIEAESEDSSRSASTAESEPSTHIFQLHNLNLTIGKEELIAVVGPVGSGKSSFVNALAGEMRQTNGTLAFSQTQALSPQSAWVQNATIRDNILFGAPFDHERYWKIIDACALRPDLALLSDGDMTEIGERGVTLSGGQKQRINIARAIYADAGIVVMDDPLSALDAQVGAHVFREAITGFLAGKCRILVTHATHVLPQCNRIIVLREGRVDAVGTYEDLLASDPGLREMLESTGKHSDEAGEKPAPGAAPEAMKEAVKVKTALMQADTRANREVSWAVYVAWLRASGSLSNGLTIILLCTLFRAANILTSLWLSWWTSDQFGLPRNTYIGIYVALAIIQGVLLFVFFMFTCFMATRASNGMSQDAMWNVLRAPMSYFDTTPLGRIIHRFSKDVDVMENNLIDALRNYLVVLSMIVGTFILIIAYFYYFTIALAVLSAVFVYTAAYYRASARELKRLQTSLDGVVFAQYSEALTGVTCIRAFRSQNRFITRLTTALDDMNSAYFLTFANQRWLSVRMDAVGNLLVFVVGLLVVTNQLNVDPSISGVILSYSLSLVQILQITVRYFSDVDNAMASTERLHEYTTAAIPPEASLTTFPSSLPPSWPSHGAIQFNSISLCYRPGLPLVLNNFSLDIASGEWIGIIGRTGAGKSSILTALFRLVELDSGTITIDGIDISKIGLHDLRSNLAIIPQDPTLFEGTIRSNLDPFSKHSDLELWTALRKCHLLPPTSSSSPTPTSLTLDAPIAPSGANFSLGERQLLTLARTLLLNTKIVLIDEGTSSLDIATDTKIQQTMREVFKDKTVVSIAHRVGTVLGFDRVVVMHEGQVEEVGSVRELWEGGHGEGKGAFRSLCEGVGIGEEEILKAEGMRRERRGGGDGDDVEGPA